MIGVFGGTFDPVHSGHLAVATQCRARLGLETVRLVPSFAPPHRGAPLASPADRLAMVRLAIEGVEGLEADDREVRRGGPSYTVDTLAEMVAADPGRELVLLLGRDAARDFGSWRRVDEVRRLARLAVFSRAGTGDGWAPGQAGIPVDAELVEVDSPHISATEIRRRLAAGEDVSGMLPPSVLAYIRDRGLYRARP